jgi:hypothetical protein
VNFWMLLAFCLAVLWLQAVVVACAALHALRAEVRARWNALLVLERLLLEHRLWVADGRIAGLLQWKAVLERAGAPEDASGLRAFFGAREGARGAVGAGVNPVLELRCSEAVRCYSEAAALYNAQFLRLKGWPLSKWMGFVPAYVTPEPGSSR